MRRCLLICGSNVLPSSLHKSSSSNNNINNNTTITNISKRVTLNSRIPVPAPRVDTNTESYQRMTRELTILSPEEFSRRLYRFSRTNFDPNHTAAVHAHVSELLRRRLEEVSIKCVREYAHLAHAAKLHELCLEIYYARVKLMSSTSTSGIDSSTSAYFAVSDTIIDSAYSIASTSDLIRLASYCVKHLQPVSSLGWEVMSAFSLLRAFWRCICIGVHHTNNHSAEAKQAFQDAAYIYDKCIAVVYPDQSKELSSENAIRSVKRFVQYASCGDEGEMLFFRFCLQKGLIQRPSDIARKFSKDNNNINNSEDTGKVVGVGVGVGQISEEKLFYASLIATCRAGQHVDAALRYFDDIGSFLGMEQVSCEDLLRPRGQKINKNNNITLENKEKKLKDEKSMEGISDYLIFQLLTVLQAAKDNKKIVYTAQAMLRDGAQLSISVWSIVLIAAGETRAVDLALTAFLQAKNALLESSHIVDRRGNEYLLQTAIHALSKCQIPRFEEDYLQPCQEQQLMHCTNEFYFCALLQNAHNSTDPDAGADKVLQAMKEKGTPLTTRIVSRLMKIYLRVESPKLLELYQYATQELKTFKSSWLDELLLWADRRRYDLTHDQRKYILEEVQRVHGIKLMEGDLGGLRTQYALLRYDYENTPREIFFRTSQPPNKEPTMLDSRVHFLLKKPYCVDHHNTDRDCNMLASVDALVGDPERRQKFMRCALLTNEGITNTGGDIRADEFRIYMGKMLETLQRSNNCFEKS